MNYNSFFGFSESPFLDVPDQRFLFVSGQHDQLWAELAQAISARRGVTVVSGEDGVGKTMLVQALVARLPQSCQPVDIIRPAAEPLAITVMFAQALGITLRDRNLVDLTPLTDAVQAAAHQGRYFMVLIDDAHLLTDQHLEEIYILSQMEQQGQQLLALVLVGRKGLVQKIASKANQRLRDLIRTNLSLSPLTFEETPRYIDHRLQQVGSSFKACFAEGCSGQLFSRTGGVPRRINQVCDQALTRAWQENRPRVSRDLLGEEKAPAPYKPLESPATWTGLRKTAALTAGLALASLTTYAIYTVYYRSGALPIQPVAVTKAPPSVPLPTAPQATPLPPPAPLAQSQPQPPAPTPETRAEPQEEALSLISPTLEEVEGAQELAVAGLSQDLLQPGQPTPEPEGARLTTTYTVTPEDVLIKIVANHYPGNKEIGYHAVILANPHISNEDRIYQGQNLLLPKVDGITKSISINNRQHFEFFRQYYVAAQADRAAAKLKELQIKYLVRETLLPDSIKVYRIFLGDYESTAELKKAVALAEKD